MILITRVRPRPWPAGTCPARREYRGDAIPSVDGHNRHRQRDDLSLVEMPAQFFVHIVGSVGLGNEGQSIGPRQGAFTIGVERRLAPRGQCVEALLGLPSRPGILGVHVDAIRATVDHRRSHTHQVEQLRLETAPAGVRLQTGHGFHRLGVHRAVVNSRFHDSRVFRVRMRRRPGRFTLGAFPHTARAGSPYRRNRLRRMNRRLAGRSARRRI